MRLIGSHEEQVLREQLIESNLALRNGEHPVLADALRSAGVDVAQAWVVGWTPDQGEDFITVITGDDAVLVVEICRSTGAYSIETDDIWRYRSHGSKHERMQYLILCELRAQVARRTP